MPDPALSGGEFKKQLRAGTPKMGLFLNAHSPTVAEQLAHSGYDWLLVDTQHGPMGYEKLSAMLSGISNGGAKSLVRVGGYDDRPGIQQALDMGADGVLVPYINTAEEARQAVSCTKYPTVGTRSVYFPQRSRRGDSKRYLAAVAAASARLAGVRVSPSGPWPAYAFAPDAVACRSAARHRA